MYGGFHDKDKLILLSEKMQVCISQIKCNDCAVGVMHLLWWLAFRHEQKSFSNSVLANSKTLCYNNLCCGEVAEWLKAADSKSARGSRPSGVQILSSPPFIIARSVVSQSKIQEVAVMNGHFLFCTETPLGLLCGDWHDRKSRIGTL